jgi:hypothetical protein
MKSILITCGAGYIGSHNVKFVREKGCRMVVLDNLSSAHGDAVIGATLVYGNAGLETAASASGGNRSARMVIGVQGLRGIVLSGLLETGRGLRIGRFNNYVNEYLRPSLLAGVGNFSVLIGVGYVL